MPPTGGDVAGAGNPRRHRRVARRRPRGLREPAESGAHRGRRRDRGGRRLDPGTGAPRASRTRHEPAGSGRRSGARRVGKRRLAGRRGLAGAGIAYATHEWIRLPRHGWPRGTDVRERAPIDGMGLARAGAAGRSATHSGHSRRTSSGPFRQRRGSSRHHDTHLAHRSRHPARRAARGRNGGRLRRRRAPGERGHDHRVAAGAFLSPARAHLLLRGRRGARQHGDDERRRGRILASRRLRGVARPRPHRRHARHDHRPAGPLRAQQRRMRLWGDVDFEDEKTRVQADSVLYHEDTGFGEAFGQSSSPISKPARKRAARTRSTTARPAWRGSIHSRTWCCAPPATGHRCRSRRRAHESRSDRGACPWSTCESSAPARPRSPTRRGSSVRTTDSSCGDIRSCCAATRACRVNRSTCTTMAATSSASWCAAPPEWCNRAPTRPGFRIRTWSKAIRRHFTSRRAN